MAWLETAMPLRSMVVKKQGKGVWSEVQAGLSALQWACSRP